MQGEAQRLRLLESRVRGEAKALVEGERRRVRLLEAQVQDQEKEARKWEARCEAAEREAERLKSEANSPPLSTLRGEVVRLQTLLSEAQQALERERHATAEEKLERETLRAQVYRLAAALKRERERGEGRARDEMERLKLQFLEREERFMLDGDRDVLQTLRGELGRLRMEVGMGGGGEAPRSAVAQQSVDDTSPTAHIRREIERLKSTGVYGGEEDPLLRELQALLPAPRIQHTI